MMRRRARFIAWCIFVLALASGPARAQLDEATPPDSVEPTPSVAPLDATDAHVDAAADGAEAGDDESDMNDLETLLGEQVVTTASRSAERASVAPATVVTIDGDTMRRYGMRSLDEALQYLGLGISVSSSGRDYTSDVDTGVQGVLLRDRNKHVLLMLDGHVMNSQSNGETRLDVALGVPLEMIDHVEVMLGPGSVSYGSNAMMAVINIVTRRARDYGRMRAVAEGTLSPPLGIHSQLASPGGGDRFGGRLRVGVGFARAGTFLGHSAEVVVHGEYQQEVSPTVDVPPQTEDRDFLPPRTAWGGRAQYQTRTPSLIVRARLGDVSLFLQGSSHYRETPFVGIFDDPSSHEHGVSLHGELRHDVVLSARASLASRLYGDHVRLEEQSSWMRSFYCLPGQQVDGCNFVRRNGSSWVGVEEQLVVDWNVDGRFETTIGGDLRFRYGAARPADYYDRITGDGPWTVRLPYWNSRSVLGALFVQQVVRAGDHWTLNVGMRFDGDSLYGVHFSPRAAVMYLPTARTTIRVGYSEAFRAPSAQDLNDTDPTYVIRPTSLGAETVRALDFEVAQRFARGSLSVRGFASRFQGLVAQRQATTAEFDAAYAAGGLVSNADPLYVTRWDNSNTIDSVGGTLAATFQPIDGLEIGSNLTLAANELKGDGPLPTIAHFYGNARISYRFGDDGPTLALVSAVSSRRTASTEPGSPIPSRLPAGPLGDLRLVASGPLASITGLTWRVAVHTSLNSRGPYVFSAGPTATTPTDTVMFAPVQRLFVFVGAQYDLR